MKRARVGVVNTLVAAAIVAIAAFALMLVSCSKGSRASTSSAVASSPLVASRPFSLDVPARYDPSTPAPLLVALHGYGADGDDLSASRFVLSELAAARGILVAHPDGTRDGQAHRFWAATDACCNFEGRSVDDAAYLIAVIDDVAARYRVDPKRVWIVGISNGGFMAHRLACEHADRVAAIVSLSGGAWADAARCAPSAPVSLLEAHGTEDAIVSYDGGIKRGASYPSVEASVAQMASKDGCTGSLVAGGAPIGFDEAHPGATTESATWSGCPTGIDVERWRMVGAAHSPKVSRAWAEAVLAWLLKHPKA